MQACILLADDLERDSERVFGTKVPKVIEFPLGVKILGFVVEFMPLGMKMNLSLTLKAKLWCSFTGSFQFSDVHAHRLLIHERGKRTFVCEWSSENANNHVALLARVFKCILARPQGESN